MRRLLGWIGGRAFEAWAKPLRERIAELEDDNHQLHMALAADVRKEEERIKAAEAASALRGQEAPSSAREGKEQKSESAERGEREGDASRGNHTG